MLTEPAAAAPTVAADSFVTLHYRLAGADGTVLIDTFGAQPATLSLGGSELAPALQACLIGLPEGAEATFELPAGQAFGQRDPAKVQWVSRRLLDELGAAGQSFAVGDVLQFPTPDGQGSYAGTVCAVGDDGAVCVDFNHPLAGQAVRLTVRIIGVL
ncbi:MAG: FKBP-type peptidyl-prolyl cis-trans isomerase [Tepidimonas sp.]|uniref:FKBP-type peptidyl-prolyl cis-trans isomerase n=1 Tax=Tepidimonas sp. TaxID=2002775 RepID=UPI00298EF4D8|nr:FKBP-type peptidyl-prolyl cis-trans isomerase [Tepidimonas sp.]MCS6811385.1 FKBP-type peptidyl-prolyl cis-trans isomerase [Tepidimonas sp.]MCX7742479.1 FKBP-type peptidyl-prolyl cis-trans isomerase [Tepidimonas sp.]MDW8335409.1 FKBP-type peptidyl-prolyl cis-trans isomerase [Tepidimonas sp.]